MAPVHPLIVTLAGALLSGLLSLPLLLRGFAFDQAIYDSLGEILRSGGIPYRDAWEMRPPGVFYLFALGSVLSGHALWGIRLLEVLALAAAGAGLARIGHSRFGSPGAGLAAAAALPLLYLPFDPRHTAQPESFQIPLLVWALALRPAEERPAPRCFLVGLLLGAAVLCKTTAVFFPLFALVERMARDARKPSWTARLTPASAMLAGCAVLPVVLILFVAVGGGLPDMTYALFDFAPRYAAGLSHPVSSLLDLGRFNLIENFSAPALLLAAVGFATGLLGRRPETVRWAAFGLAAALSVVVQFKFYKYHYLVLAPFLALLMALPLLATGRSAARIVALAGALLLAAAWGILALRRSAESWRALAGRPAPECDLRQGRVRVCDAHRAASAIASRTQPEDRVFVWGNEPLLYVFSGRRPAAPHVYIGPALAPWVGDRFEGEILERLRAAPPRLIVTVCDDALPWMPEPREDSEKALERFPRMREFIRSNYSEVETLGRHRLWARSGS